MVLDIALLFGTRVAEPILAGGHVHRHQQTGHMIASDPIRPLPSSCKPGAVHIWGARKEGQIMNNKAWDRIFATLIVVAVSILAVLTFGSL
jgi:hypothetical protein